MRRLTLLVPLALLGLVLAGTTVHSKKKTEVRDFTLVNIQYKGTKVWVPGTLIVKKNDSVRIKLINNAPSGKHGFAIDEFGVKTVVHGQKTEIVEFTAGKAGLYRIYCHLHGAHIGGQLLVLKK